MDGTIGESGKGKEGARRRFLAQSVPFSKDHSLIHPMTDPDGESNNSSKLGSDFVTIGLR